MVRAIIADDEADSAEVFAEFLRIHKVDVLGIGKNGLEGVELYKAHKPDIVFLDLAMPQYNGVYAAEKIKQIDPRAKIVIISAYDPCIVKRQLAGIQVSGVLQKPYVLSEIQSVLYPKINA
ncbi:MAG: response regulator [Nitrososphaeria archaeon]|nr:response regulator [Nitrososphaeria archaeon]NDB50842.1 response regulator [Nitrosopumilaceae archaeon]NDB89537.1 response regulator [Nitrososphaerota archaeon]NDB46011.1 response regulator [Nitrososphaeria archaeon]NDF24734.1 response regulator [Nitrososphaerota archaeon]